MTKIRIGRRFSRILVTPASALYRPTPHFFALIKSSCLLQQYGHLGSRHAPSPLFSDFFNDFSACSLRTQPASFFSLSLFRFLFSHSSLLSRSLSLSFSRLSLHPFFSFTTNMFHLCQNLRGYHLRLSCRHQHPHPRVLMYNVHYVRTYVRARAPAKMCSARKCMHEGIVLKRGTAVIPIRAKCACNRRRKTQVVRGRRKNG